MKNKLIISIIFSIFLLGLISASLGTYKQGDCVQIKTILPNSSYVNISTISYPNSTISESNIEMTKIAQSFIYDYCSTFVIGDYVYDYCDSGGECYVNDFTITSNGNPPASGIVITIFIIFFIVLLLFTSYMIIYSIGHVIKLDFDVIDLAWNYGVFFVLIGLKITENSYLGNVAIEGFLSWAIDIGIWVLMILPTIYFILTLTVGSILSKRIKGVDY